MKLTLEEVIRAREQRILKHLSSYQRVADLTPELSTMLPNLLNIEAAALLGVYWNAPDQASDGFAVTLRGIAIFTHSWELIRFEHIQRASIPIPEPTQKRDVEAIQLSLVSGREVSLPVKGGNERTRDVWEVLRFLLRVTHDVKSRQELGN